MAIAPSFASARRPWRQLREEEWLLRAVLTFVEDDGDEIHCLWLLALDDELPDLRSFLEQHFPVSVDHARRLAMLHSMRFALLKLSSYLKLTADQRLSTETVDEIETQLQAWGITPHALRRQALHNAVGRDHKASSLRSASCTYCGRRHAHTCHGRLHRCTAPGSTEIAHFCRFQGAFVMYVAAQRGYLESVVWLHYVVCYDQEKALSLAARAGHVEIVTWLLDHAHASITVDFRYRDDEALGVMAWRVQPFSQYYTMTKRWGVESALDCYLPECMAVKRGDVEGLRELLAHPFTRPLFASKIVSYAMSYGSIPILSFLLENCREVFSTDLDIWSAASNGRVDMAEWLLAHGFGEINDRVVRAAVIHGQVAFLQWILRTAPNPDDMRQTMIREAASGTTLETLQWLAMKQGLRLNPTTHVRNAIGRRDTEQVKWIVDYCAATQTLRNSASLLEAAIKTDNFALVQWLVENHNLWSLRAFPLASMGKSAAMLEFFYTIILARPTPSPSLLPDTPLFVAQARKDFDCDYLDTIEWLLDHDFRSGLFAHGALDSVLRIEWQHAETKRQLNLYTIYRPTTIRRLRDMLCRVIDEYDSDYIRQVLWLPKWAARHGRLETLRRLAELGHVNVFSRRLFDNLLSASGSEHVVRWYLEQKPEYFTTLVVRWAVQHGKRGVFEWVFQSFLRTRDELIAKCVWTARWTAKRYDRRELMQLLQLWIPHASNPAKPLHQICDV